jgi:hypothetical protein
MLNYAKIAKLINLIQAGERSIGALTVPKAAENQTFLTRLATTLRIQPSFPHPLPNTFSHFFFFFLKTFYNYYMYELS